MVGIYYCARCFCQLDKLIQRHLGRRHTFRRIHHAYYGALNYVMATGAADPTWFLAFVTVTCYCGQEYIAIFRTRFETSEEVELACTDFRLIHVDGAIFSPLQGVYRGKRVKAFIGGFLRRWHVLAEHTIVCTPFISSRFTHGEWEWIFQQSSAYNTHVITRPQSAGLIKRLPIFKKDLDDSGLMELVFDVSADDPTRKFEEQVLSPLITGTVELRLHKFQKFHAKFFAGILSDRVEVLLSSYNLFLKEDTQLEQICVHTYTRETFANRFLLPFGIEQISSIPDAKLELRDIVEVAVYSDRRTELRHEKYVGKIWEVITRELTAQSADHSHS